MRYVVPNSLYLQVFRDKDQACRSTSLVSADIYLIPLVWPPTCRSNGGVYPRIRILEPAPSEHRPPPHALLGSVRSER